MFCSWALGEGRGEENCSSTHFCLMNSWPALNSLWSLESLVILAFDAREPRVRVGNVGSLGGRSVLARDVPPAPAARGGEWRTNRAENPRAEVSVCPHRLATPGHRKAVGIRP